jgi:type IV pilus assembly protein PilY1
VATPDIAETRRFYNAPDVSLIQSRGSASFMAVNIGSGYRGHPLHRATVDRFYSLRDKLPFRKMTQAEYNAFTPITDTTAGLVDITANPAGAALLPTDIGWKYVLSANAGEKALSEATTVGGTVLFTTYQPLDPDPRTPCHSQHRNRAYAFNVQSGKPALDLNNDGNITNADLFEVVNHDGILGNVNVVVLRGGLLDQYNAACQASGPLACRGEDTSSEGKLICQAGMHIMGRCVPIGDGGRNFWRKQADGG